MMNPTVLFFIAVATITTLVLWALLRPLLRRRADASAAAGGDANAANSDSNVQSLRIELSDARRDHALGLLSDASLVEAERELEARVLSEAQTERSAVTPRYRGTAIALSISLPVFALLGYAMMGSPLALLPEAARTPSALVDDQMEEILRGAEARLAREPNDVKGWRLLAHAKASLGRYPGAIDAYEKAVALTPQDANLWADYADAVAGAADGKVAGKPLELITRALALEEKNAKALLLRGTYEMQINDLISAEKTFTLAKSLVKADSGLAQIAVGALADIQARNGAPGSSAATTNGASNSGVASLAAAVPAPATAATAATSAGAPLASVQVILSGEARKSLAAGGAVFVILRQAGGAGGPPLAAKKLQGPDIDRLLRLTAADAMLGGDSLKPGTEVTVQARLSLTGQPMAKPGDWQSGRFTVTLPAATLTLVIDQAVAN